MQLFADLESIEKVCKELKRKMNPKQFKDPSIMFTILLLLHENIARIASRQWIKSWKRTSYFVMPVFKD